MSNLYDSVPFSALRWLNNLSGATLEPIGPAAETTASGWLPSSISDLLEQDKIYVLTLIGESDAVVEIVGVVKKVDSYTVYRGQEGSLARGWPAGSKIYQSITAYQYGQLMASGVLPSSIKSSAYTLKAADIGSSIDTTANVTIPNLAEIPVGAVVVITNTGSLAINIKQAAGVTLRLAAAATTGDLSLAGYGVATLRQTSAKTWLAVGMGLS